MPQIAVQQASTLQTVKRRHRLPDIQILIVIAIPIGVTDQPTEPDRQKTDRTTDKSKVGYISLEVQVSCPAPCCSKD